MSGNAGDQPPPAADVPPQQPASDLPKLEPIKTEPVAVKMENVPEASPAAPVVEAPAPVPASTAPAAPAPTPATEATPAPAPITAPAPVPVAAPAPPMAPGVVNAAPAASAAAAAATTPVVPSVVPTTPNAPVVPAPPQMMSSLEAPVSRPAGDPPAPTAVYQRSVVVPPAATAQPQQQGQFRQVKFENALDFLDEVKLVFANQPEVYNQFLDIMKEFKTKHIDTPGVIMRVKELFKGRPALVLGFNNFLPPGYKITLPLHEGGEGEGAAASGAKEQPAAKQYSKPAAPAAPSQAGAGGQAGGDGKQPEFDHARNFVKKIKMRFALHPSIYKAFLEILHLYHKGSHNIRDVYNQVAKLFQNHPDLLEEFTQFLPDTTGTASIHVQPEEKRRGKATREKRATQKRASAKREPKEKKDSYRNRHDDDDDDSDALPERKRTRGQTHLDSLEGTKEEKKFLEEVFATLNNSQIYVDFMKALTLYNKQLVSRSSMLEYAKELFVKSPDLYERFRRFCNSQAGIKPARSVAVPHFTEMDFGSLQRYGVSYRALPKMYRKGVCSGRTDEDQLVLNDTWVSVPTGKEDEQVTFRGSLKNQYEEVLFQCEDDRYELDLVVELNASTIRFLEPIRAQLAELPDAELKKFKIQAPLDVLHQRSIERLYGAEGSAIIDALFDNPSVAVPVILSRLKQKDREWRQNRREWDRIWREVSEKNQMRALDHESLGFKNTDKKNFTSKPLMSELQVRYQDRLKDISQGKTDAASQVDQPHMTFEFLDSGILSDVEDLVLSSLKSRSSSFDGEPLVDTTKARKFFSHFVRKFLGYQNGEDDAAAGAAASEASQEGGSDNVDESKRKRRKQSTTNNNNNNGGAGAQDPALQPVTVYLADAPREVPLQTFYANKRFYVFFRVFALMAARLRRAKELQLYSGTALWKPFNIIPEEKEEAQAKNDEKYSTLLSNIKKLMSGDIDNGKFEDDCREMFGIHSYLLFTMDRLLDFMCRRLTSILTGDSTKLLGLWEYEQKRMGAGGGLQEPTYCANAREVVGPREKLIRLCFVENKKTDDAPEIVVSNAPPKPPADMDKLLTMELLPSSIQPRVVELAKEQTEWSKYVHQYVHDPPADLDTRARHLFLHRNMKRTYSDLGSALADTGAKNGVRAKISLKTYKMFYAESTEDVFVRKVDNSAAKQEAAKKVREERFRKWLDGLGFVN